MAAGRSLSELEGTVLGILRLRQPCTAYAVRRVFSRSSSRRWSGSAGAIYPLMSRLASRGLVASEAVARGRQKTRHYRLTPRGFHLLRRWLMSIASSPEVVVPADPLRTRLAFFSVLEPEERRAVVKEALALLVAARDEAAEDSGESPEDPYDGLAARGALRVLEARIRWLEEVRRTQGPGKR